MPSGVGRTGAGDPMASSESLAATIFDYDLTPSALILAHRAGRRALLEAAGDTAGFRILASGAFEEVTSLLSAAATADLAVLDCTGAAPDAVAAIMHRVLPLAEKQHPAWIVAIDRDQIDAIAPLLGHPRCQILCEENAADRFAALTLARRRVPLRFRDVGRDPDTRQLRALSEDIARIADALLRLTEDTTAPEPLRIRAPGTGYRGPDGERRNGGGLADGIDAAAVRGVIRARRLRSQFFGEDLFADPAWDMLLDLFAATLENRRVSVSSLCIAAAVPPTTALRWIGTLHDVGLFERQADPHDRRRAYIGLTERALDAMRAYAGALRNAGLGLA